MINWQLIKSAPKDGTAVLAYGPSMEPNIYVLRFEELEMDDHDALGNVVRRVFWVGWREAGGEGHEMFEPTLWMPLDPLIASAMLVDANERKPEKPYVLPIKDKAAREASLGPAYRNAKGELRERKPE